MTNLEKVNDYIGKNLDTLNFPQANKSVFLGGSPYKLEFDGDGYTTSDGSGLAFALKSPCKVKFVTANNAVEHVFRYQIDSDDLEKMANNTDLIDVFFENIRKNAESRLEKESKGEHGVQLTFSVMGNHVPIVRELEQPNTYEIRAYANLAE